MKDKLNILCFFLVVVVVVGSFLSLPVSKEVIHKFKLFLLVIFVEIFICASLSVITLALETTTATLYNLM